MNNYVCVTCGTQFSETDQPPGRCPICEDERQFVNWEGQQWTTLNQLRVSHSNRIEEEGTSLVGIGTEPSFAIGQRALLVQSPGGNLLWDCVTLLDDQTIVGGWWKRNVLSDGKGVIQRSAERYLHALDTLPSP